MATKLAERQANERDSTSSTWTGSCFCGAVRFTVSGEPTAMGYCHCESCRSWAAAPVNAFTLWNLVDAYAAYIPEFPYRAAVHVNYQESRLRMRDGLPKMKDLPK